MRAWSCRDLLPWLWKEVPSAYFRTVIMLNSPTATPAFLPALWASASFRACADGAANRLQELDPGLVPEVVLGDFDSARSEVLRDMEQAGTAVVRRPSQDATDLQKLLRYAPLEDALLHGGGGAAVLGGLGGLFSHQCANLNGALEYQMHAPADAAPLVFLDASEVCVLLMPGTTVLEEVPAEPLHASVLPIFGPVAAVSSTGLQWELREQPSCFGGLVSSSNRAADGVDRLELCVSQPMLLTLERRQ